MPEKTPKSSRSPKKATSKKTTTKLSLKLTEEDKKKFPYNNFPVKVIHMEGKDLTDRKVCYFMNEVYAKKYIERSNFKKNDYLLIAK